MTDNRDRPCEKERSLGIDSTSETNLERKKYLGEGYRDKFKHLETMNS